jgi:hypothetical protein
VPADNGRPAAGADLAAIDRLCRMQLEARRLGCRIVLHDLDDQLHDLIIFTGVADLLITPSSEETTMELAQGDLRLLDTPLAQRLLRAAVPARLAYIALDGAPRVIPINSHWSGDRLVMGAFAGTHKLGALAAHPDVAITIDTSDAGAEVLLLRGAAELTAVRGLLPEYALAQRRVMGEDSSEEYLAAIDTPDLEMVRISVRPTWVGLLDFQTRLPERTPTVVRRALA